jgi:hypothetical protein
MSSRFSRSYGYHTPTRQRGVVSQRHSRPLRVGSDPRCRHRELADRWPKDYSSYD